MNIKINEYTIKPNGFGNYDLFKEMLGTKEDSGEKYLYDNVVAYGCSMESCVNRIVYENVLSKDETVDIKTFLAEYKKETKVIKDMIGI